MVADFGVARAVSDMHEKLTATGMVVGTPVYMSPEQAAGEKEIDGRSDQYALASVLYEMIAGEPPFRGATPTATLMRRFAGPPQPLRPVFDIPEAVERAILRALEREPTARYASVSAFIDALEGQGGGAGCDPGPGGVRRRTPPLRPAAASSGRSSAAASRNADRPGLGHCGRRQGAGTLCRPLVVTGGAPPTTCGSPSNGCLAPRCRWTCKRRSPNSRSCGRSPHRCRPTPGWCRWPRGPTPRTRVALVVIAFGMAGAGMPTSTQGSMLVTAQRACMNGSGMWESTLSVVVEWRRVATGGLHRCDLRRPPATPTPTMAGRRTPSRPRGRMQRGPRQRAPRSATRPAAPRAGCRRPPSRA